MGFVSDRIRLLVVICLSSMVGAAAETTLTKDELSKIQEGLKSFDVLTVDFTQSTETPLSKVRGKGRKREGRAVLAKPNHFRWTLLTPKTEHKIYDGSHFYEFDPATNSAKRYSLTGPQSYEVRTIVDMVLNFETLLKRYDVTKATRDGDEVKILLTPKTPGEITDVELHLSVKDSYVTYVRWSMQGGTSMAHTFRNPSRKAIGDDAFSLPKGASVQDSN